MKRILVVAFSFLIVLVSCDTLKKVASILVPSEFEMATGLKDALTQGLFKSFDAFADPQGNPLVRFAFPGDAAKIEKTLRDLGLDKAVDQVTGKFTRATSSAVKAAKPIFLQSVKKMSIKDAANILVTDNTHAATEYFKTTMSPELMVAFRPIEETIRGFNMIMDGEVDEYPEAAFNLVGSIDDAIEKGKKMMAAAQG